MSKTVIGIFDSERNAQNAQNYLLANGFEDEQVDIKTASYKTKQEDSSEEDSDDENLFNRIGEFFKHLFEGDGESSELYANAGKRGTIVTVHTTSEEEAQVAVKILNNFGAADINRDRNGQKTEIEFEDPIINPPSEGLRSVTFRQAVDEKFRLRQNTNNMNEINIEGVITGTSLDPPKQGYIPIDNSDDNSVVRENEQGAVPLNNTISERDALINKIVNNRVSGG